MDAVLDHEGNEAYGLVAVLSLIIIDDHRIVRDGLRSLMEHSGFMQVVGEASEGREGVDLVLRKRPAVVLMDMSMPQLNGIDATRQLRGKGYAGGIVMLSMHSDAHVVRSAQAAGIDGYVLKEHAFEQLKEATEAAAKRQSYLSPQLDAGLARPSPLDVLTRREREILQLLAEGRTGKDIAFSLGLSSKTVDVHRANLQKKLGVGSLAELTRIALREGLAQL